VEAVLGVAASAPLPVAVEPVAGALALLAAGEFPVAVEPCADTVGAAAGAAVAEGATAKAIRIADMRREVWSVFIVECGIFTIPPITSGIAHAIALRRINLLIKSLLRCMIQIAVRLLPSPCPTLVALCTFLAENQKDGDCANRHLG
jgi:hypothetical protein